MVISHMLNITQDQVLKALLKRNIKFNHRCLNLLQLVTDVEINEGMKLVRICDNIELSFGAIVKCVYNSWDDFIVETLDTKRRLSLDKNRFIPLDWLQVETKSYYPDWF